MIKYDKLLKLLEDNNYTSFTAKNEGKDAAISQGTLTKLKKGEGGVDHVTIERICKRFNVQPSDIMEYVPDD